MFILKRAHHIWMTLAIIIALCGCACFCMNASAYADDSQTGSITLHKMKAPTSDATILPSDSVPIPNVQFSITKLSDDAEAANGSNPRVTLDSEPLTSFAVQFATTDSSGIAVFDNLERGVYLIEETYSAGMQPAQQKFLVAIPMEESNSSYNWDIDVYPKSSEVALLEKVVDSPKMVMGVGEVVPWKITQNFNGLITRINADDSISYAKSWHISDTLDTRLDYIAGTTTVTLYNADGSAASVQLAWDSDIFETFDESTNTINWSIADDALKQIADSGATYIEISLETRINDTAYESSNAIFNDAMLHFTNAASDPVEFEVISNGVPDENNASHPRVYVGTIVIDKYYEQTQQKLAGATFKIAASEADAKAGHFITRSLEGVVSDITLTTDSNGSAYLGGLSAGTYWLVEVVAPTFTDENGKTITCAQAAFPIKVEIGQDTSGNMTTVSVPNHQETVADTIVQTVVTGSLPKTGDSFWLPLLLVLVAGATTIVIARKKLNKRADESRR